MKKYPYVLISIDGREEYWPYPECQEFILYDVSDSIVYLTEREVLELQNKLDKKKDTN